MTKRITIRKRKGYYSWRKRHGRYSYSRKPLLFFPAIGIVSYRYRNYYGNADRRSS